MQGIIFYKSSSKALKIILLSFPFIAIGYWFILFESSGSFQYILGWFSVCFFGLCFPVGLFQLFDKRPQVIINEISIWSRSFQKNEIKWDQITENHILDIYGQKFLSIITIESYKPDNQKNFPSKRFFKNNKGNQYTLYLNQINQNDEKFMNLINSMINANVLERKEILLNYNFVTETKGVIYKFIISVFILIFLIGLTFKFSFFFFLIIIPMGLSAIILRWSNFSLINKNLRRLSEYITLMGFLYLAIFFFSIKFYDYESNDLGKKLVKQIEIYKDKHNVYPENLKKLGNIPKTDYFQKKIIYCVNIILVYDNYTLIIKKFNGDFKKFNKIENKWV